MNKESNIFKNIITVLLALLIFGMLAGTADAAFYFHGTTRNETTSWLNNTNVSIEVYTFGQGGPQLIGTYYNNSNATGFFNVTGIPDDNPTYLYKLILKHFNETTNNLDYIGQALPELPYLEISQLGTKTRPMKFNLRTGGTINITATNGTTPQTFRYMIKDTRLGYPIASNFNSEVPSVVVYVPRERNYSIMIYPNQSFPVSYDLNNLTTYTDNYANITFNTSNTLRRVSGYANLSDNSSNFSDLKIIAYLMEPGNMIFQDQPLPYNMSAWNCPTGPGSCESDVYNATNGSYSITLPGAAMNANILLFATAYNSTSGNYSGAFRNISLGYSLDPVTSFNFSLQTLLGTPTNITLNNASASGSPGNISIQTNKLAFQVRNSTGVNITGFAHVEVRVNYSAYNGSTFGWMGDVSQSSNGSFSIPALDADIRKINIFTQGFAPKKTSKTASQLASQPVNINLSSFNPGGINGTGFSNVIIDLLKSRPECDVPYPASSCSLGDSGGQNMTDFNPFEVVIGGGKISMRMIIPSNNVTVHYKNVDMLASGPPDALFDSNANQSAQNGTALEQAWRFGSLGPEIYDEVLIGIPLSADVRTDNVSVKLGKLYDDNWNATWNISAGNTTSDLPSDYSTFNTTWFNATTGMPCSTSDPTANCYVNITNRMVWLKIPHFSGVGPTVSSVVGNVTVNLTNSTGTAGSSAIMNFTVIDTSNTTSWYNITFPSGFNAGGAIVNITINGSADPADWNKTATPSYVNVTSTSAATANTNNLTYINMSNVTVPSTTGNHTINVTTSRGVTVSLNYTVVNYSVSLSVDTTVRTTNAGINATYTLTLQNNGTATDSYNLTVANGSASIAALNVSGNITLNASETRTLTLNVTNTSSGVFRVNVTAVSLNDTSKFAYINTTTTVPIVITITNPATNGSTNTTGYVNVTATLDATGLAQYLNWQGQNYSMTPNTSSSAGTAFYRNMTGLLSGNYSFKIYANDSNASNASETRIITVNRTNSTSLAAIVNTTTFLVNATINITSPSGNVTVTIPNGTNASVSGAALTSVAIDSLAQVNSTFVAALGSSDTLIGENLSLGPDGAQFSPDIQIQFNYTDAQLTAAGISESQFSVKFYNTTTNAWVTQTTYSQNTTGNYIIVNVSHFSTFGLIGTTTTTTTTTTGGSSSSTGSSGVVTSEPSTNIEKAERYDKSLIANTPVTYTFKAPELGIYEVAVTGKESENDIALRVEALKGTSKQVTVQAPGTVYKNLNILAGTKRIKEVLIRFKVENSWLTSNNFAGGDVKLVKWDGSQWVQLETSEKTKDASFTYFEAKSDSLSSFAIAGLKGVTVPTATPATGVTETPKPTGTATAAPTPAPTEKVPGFELVLAAAALCAIYLFGRKRR